MRYNTNILKNFFATPRQRFLTIFSIITLTVTVATTIVVGRSRVQSRSVEPETEGLVMSAVDISQPPEDLTTLTVALLGYGGAGHDGGFLTDVIQLLHVDFERQRIFLVSIPRDLWVELPTGKQAKINEAFTLGEDPNQPVASGGEISKQMAQAVTGLPVQNFIAVDFVGFKRIVGQELTGITVNVTETLDDPWYPIKGEEQNPCEYTPEEIAELSATLSGFELEKQFECRYEHIHFAPGSTEMNGHEALAYVRSRHGSNGGDFSRSARQQALLQGLKKELLSVKALENVPTIFEAMTTHVTTDFSLETLNYLAPALNLATDYSIETVVLSTENVLTTSRSSTGQFIVIPKEGNNQWSGVRAYVQAQLATTQ